MSAHIRKCHELCVRPRRRTGIIPLPCVDSKKAWIILIITIIGYGCFVSKGLAFNLPRDSAHVRTWPICEREKLTSFLHERVRKNQGPTPTVHGNGVLRTHFTTTINVSDWQLTSIRPSITVSLTHCHYYIARISIQPCTLKFHKKKLHFVLKVLNPEKL